jgi:nitrite reductase/ring-hydroxylating ferredoxin subunit
MIELRRYWHPLATAAELARGKPLARTLLGVPLVLFRDASGQAAALQDRCPHRHAPLSCGRVRNGEVECPYHGWRFAADGRCTSVPGMELPASNKPLVDAFACQVAHGLVWVCLAPDAATPPPAMPAVTDNVDYFFMTDTVNCTIQQAAENFLDGFHTHFVHAGWIRRDSQRQPVRAIVHHLADGVEARYSDEGLQSGLISSLLEGDRQTSMGRFRLPGVAEIEYRGRRGLNLLISAWLTPESDQRLRIHARVATRCGILPGWLKKLFLRQLFGVILRQDKRILEQTSQNVGCFQEAGLDVPLLDSRLDLLAPSIRQLLAGETLTVEDGWAIECWL